MSAGIYPLYIEQGATFIRECQYLDSAGVPVDLTGMTLAGQIRRSYSDPNITLSFVITIANQAIPANLGKFTISITAANTALIVVNPAVDFENTSTMYTYDIELDTGSVIKRLLQGPVYVSPEVTR